MDNFLEKLSTVSIQKLSSIQEISLIDYLK